MRIISRDQISQLVPMHHAIDAVAQAFAQLAAGEAVVPQRQRVAVPPVDGLALLMPAYLQASDALGVKLLTVFPQNAASDLPTIQALVVLFDTATGTPLALMDGTYLTALRTGAASGVATQAMARDDAHTLALFGAGATALHQVLAICTVRSITRVLLVNRSADRAVQLAETLRGFGTPVPPDVRVAPSVAIALREADIVCLATAASAPLFDDADVRPGTHINGIGSYMPTMQELPGATVARARVVVDQRQTAWAEAGDLIIPRNAGMISESHVVAELGEIVRGSVCGRTSDSEITFFKSVGNAVQDVAVARLAYTLAQKAGVGTEIVL